MIIDWSLILEEGIIITIVGYVIVFLALLLLFYVFTYLARLVNYQARRRLRLQGKNQHLEEQELMIEGDVSAAIAMALYFYIELHDEEPNVLTIRRMSKTYSPWSSRIYQMRRQYR
jgi:Na+-transporting methylmalonyl-CoA/oxaloacetate decarboxylase gamma subunit